MLKFKNNVRKRSFVALKNYKYLWRSMSIHSDYINCYFSHASSLYKF